MDTINLATVMIRDLEGRLLAVRKKKSLYYMMPGGKIEPNETYPEALARELNEELGLAIQLTDLHFIGSHRAIAVNEKHTMVEANIFLLHIFDPFKISAKSEIEEIVWLTRDTYRQYKLAHLLEEFALPRWLNAGV